MAEILHQLIGSSSQYLKGFSTIPGGFLAGFLVAIFPVFYDDILGPRDFYDFRLSVKPTHQSPVTTKQRPLLPGLPGLGCLLLTPPPNNETNHDGTGPWLPTDLLQPAPCPEARTSKASTFWVKFWMFLVTSNCPWVEFSEGPYLLMVQKSGDHQLRER